MVDEERTRELSVPNSEKSRLVGELTALFSYSKGGFKEDNSSWGCTVERLETMDRSWNMVNSS